MSLLVRAALLGGLAYVVTRAVRNRERSLNSSSSEALQLARDPVDTQADIASPHNQPSATNV